MIVQPAPTSPRGPVRRGLRAVGLVTPFVLLAVVAGAGALGPKPEPSGPAPPRGDAASPAASGGFVPPVGSAVIGVPGIPAGPAPAFPAVAADLAVLSVSAAQPRLAAADGRPVAVAGWLGSPDAPATCPAADGDTRGTRSPLCERHARLVVANPAAADPGAHLHVTFPPGVRLPPSFEDSLPDEPVAVVIVGRAASPDAACTTSAFGCAEQLVADRVMWSAGAPFDPGPVFDAGLEVPPPRIALRRLPEAETLATGWSGTILVAAAVRAVTVGFIDPVAAAAMALGPKPTGLVWYVRGLETAYDPGRYPLDHAPPRLSWAVVDEQTGATIARGFEDPGGFPSTVAGRPVYDVGSALRARAAGLVGGVVAVSGWFRAWADPRACTEPIAGLQGGGCARTALLVGGPWSDVPGLDRATLPPNVDAVVAPGVGVPDRAVGLDSNDLGPPPPVVVLGRFDGSGRLIVERVAWASGGVVALGRQVAAGLEAAPDDPVGAATGDAVRTALDGASTILRVVLAPATGLHAIDPQAATATDPALQDPSAPVWYVRGLDQATGAIRWAVLEPGTGRVLASAAAS